MIKTVCLLAVLMLTAITAQAQQRHSDTFDTMLEYAPYASVVTLKACGVKSRDDWPQLAVTTAATWFTAAGTAWMLKNTIKERRPDGTNQRSFPSGHTFISFAGATALHKEFGKTSPWISVAGYGVATLVGIDRIVGDRHHWYDVAAGAGIGIAATEVVWYVSDKIFKKNKNVTIGFSGNTLDMCIAL